MEKMEELDEGEEIAPTDIREEDIEKAGWLYKESRFWKVWRKRWVILTKKGIKIEGRSVPTQHSWVFSFESDDWRNETKPTERICMGKCRTVKSIEDEINKPNAFKIDIAGTIFNFQADSYSEKEAWIGALGRAMIKKSVMMDENFDKMPDFL